MNTPNERLTQGVVPEKTTDATDSSAFYCAPLFYNDSHATYLLSEHPRYIMVCLNTSEFGPSHVAGPAHHSRSLSNKPFLRRNRAVKAYRIVVKMKGGAQ